MRTTLIFLLLLLSEISFSKTNLNSLDTNSKITLKTKINIWDCDGCNSNNDNGELDQQIKNYQYDNRYWTTHVYPIVAIILSLFTVIGVFITIRKQSEVAKADRDHLNAKWEHEVRERQNEQAAVIAKNEEDKEKQRIKDKLATDSNTLDDLMKYLKSEKGTVSEATYYAIAIISALTTEGYPESFKNIASGIKRILIDFFAFDAVFFSKPHHAFLHNQLLKNIQEFRARTIEMEPAELTQLMQRYEVALKKVMQSEIGTFYSSWIAFLDTKDIRFAETQRDYPDETHLATTLISNLIILYDLFPDGHLVRNAIRGITKEAYGSEDLFKKLILPNKSK